LSELKLDPLQTYSKPPSAIVFESKSNFRMLIWRSNGVLGRMGVFLWLHGS
jgi:hypothetical protein